MDFCAKRYNANPTNAVGRRRRGCGLCLAGPHIIAAKKQKAAMRNSGRPCVGYVSQALVAFALHPLAHQFAHPVGRFSGFARTALGRLFIGPAILHLAEHAFTLQLFLQHAECLVNIVVSYGYVHVDHTLRKVGLRADMRCPCIGCGVVA